MFQLDFSKSVMLKVVRSFAQALLIVAALAARPAQAQTFTVLYSFKGQAAGDGVTPLGPLALDSQGNLYGTTVYGGSHNNGTVFKLDTTGHETVLYSFSNGDDGGQPYGGVVRDSQGSLYGTTYSGGPRGAGTVFKIDSTGHESVLYGFGDGNDGGYPFSTLVRDAAGNLYGSTPGGGRGSQGVVFKVDPNGNETVLHAFTEHADGSGPSRILALDPAGNVYGTAYYGGAVTPFCNGCGTAFKIDAQGNLTLLESFIGGQDGNQPNDGVVRDAAGNLYISASQGGGSGYGIVFKLAPNGSETLLYSFLGGTDASYPSQLARDRHGNLYGIGGGGANNLGSVFKIDAQGNETVLYSFTANISVNQSLIVDSAGNLYGTADAGGTSGNGMIFKLTP